MDFTNHFITSAYSDNLMLIKKVISFSTTYSRYMILLELIYDKYSKRLADYVRTGDKLQYLENRTIINMIQQIKEKQFDKAEMSFTTLKSVGMKILEYFEDDKLSISLQHNRHKGEIQEVIGDGAVYMAANDIKFNIDTMECLLHKAYTFEV